MGIPNHILTAVGVVALLLTVGSTARAEPYHDATHHFTVDLPGGWGLASADEVGEINRVVGRLMPGNAVTYTAAFRPQVRTFRPQPFVLVQVVPEKLARLSYDE